MAARMLFRAVRSRLRSLAVVFPALDVLAVAPCRRRRPSSSLPRVCSLMRSRAPLRAGPQVVRTSNFSTPSLAGSPAFPPPVASWYTPMLADRSQERPAAPAPARNHRNIGECLGSTADRGRQCAQFRSVRWTRCSKRWISAVPAVAAHSRRVAACARQLGTVRRPRPAGTGDPGNRRRWSTTPARWSAAPTDPISGLETWCGLDEDVADILWYPRAGSTTIAMPRSARGCWPWRTSSTSSRPPREYQVPLQPETRADGDCARSGPPVLPAGRQRADGGAARALDDAARAGRC